ncbi:MAG TPA: DUF3995 domain-containing protein [Cyclobacteriaceae bacterium]
MTILSILLFIIFIILGLLHFSWAFGMHGGFADALPTKEDGKRVLNPGKIDSAMVGIGLTAFGFFYLIKSELVANILPEWIIKYGSWIIPSIFILRSIGEFRYVGFFKKIKKTRFATLDTKFYSPLCLGLGIIGLIIEIMK